MAHEITIRADQSAEAAFSRVPPWHGLGVVLDHPMTSEEAMKAAQLDWRVETRPLAVCHGCLGTRMLENRRAVVRCDTNEVLGVVSDVYRIIQNIEAFQFMDKLLEDEVMKYEAAFSLYGGKTVVLLGRMPEIDYITDSDTALRYILLSTSHDGSSAVRFGPTSVRVVCANTYKLALGQGNIARWSVPHRRGIESKLQQARRIIGDARKRFDIYVEQARELARVRWSDEQFTAFLDIVYPRIPREDPDYTVYRAQGIELKRRNITQLYYHDECQLDPSVYRTAWAAVNAVIQYIDYLPRRGATPRHRAEARFTVALYGKGRDMKERAFAAARRISQLAT